MCLNLTFCWVLKKTAQQGPWARGSETGLPKLECHPLVNYYATFNKLHITSLSILENGATLEPFHRVWTGMSSNVCKMPRETDTLVLQNIKKFAFAETDLLITFFDQLLPTLKVSFSFSFFWGNISQCHYCCPKLYIEQASFELKRSAFCLSSVGI